MGASRKCNDNTQLLDIAAQFNLPQEEIIKLANFPLKKVSEAVGKAAPDGEKGRMAQEFMDAAEAAEIIDTSDTRYTLT
jgi:hypothetical protein